MLNFIVGQKWISNAEPELAMGRITQIEHRTISIYFDVAGELRTYAKDQAPLTRVKFNPEDIIKTMDGIEFTVTDVTEEDGFHTYYGEHEGEAIEVLETELDANVRFSKPQDRLFTLQFDKNAWFNLRYMSLYHTARLAESKSRGLYGARASLIPHQLYIANEVASRFAPRVLLADEVGLGKTIEAGLIVHQQLQTGRASRILIIVPPTLTFQWFVEMIRRFNLHFTVMDENRCLQIAADNRDDVDDDMQFDEASDDMSDTDSLPIHANFNPFEAQQLMLCSLDLFTNHPERLAEVIDTELDLVVVDEAHHLEWTPEESSIEYDVVSLISQLTKGLLLLTATPEQLGRSGHFARLRLLDPDRFHNFEAFCAEDAEFETVANAANHLLDGEESEQEQARLDIKELLNLTDEDLHPPIDVAELVSSIVSAGEDDEEDEAGDDYGYDDLPSSTEPTQADIDSALIDALIDRHGTGRVLFRNVRQAIKGFPVRIPAPVALEPPEAYRAIDSYFPQEGVGDWTRFDPRLDWLVDLLESRSEDKFLLICAHQETVHALEKRLAELTATRLTVFHEGMNLVARDRAAQYFAETEQGAQLMICSEIGSEGRNFQFASDLVMFDLPASPDLLEQRIGRLDRIGQKNDVTIHIPYFSGLLSEKLYRLYDEGLNVFRGPNPVAQSIFDHLQAHLKNAEIEQLITDVAAENEEKLNNLNLGRDKLLELNSHRRDVSHAVVRDIQDNEGGVELERYMERSFQLFGLESELSGNIVHVKPTEGMIRNDLVSVETQSHFAYPELPEDGIRLTYDRDTALAVEDVGFFTWEHPMVQQALDLAITDVQGNSTMIAVKDPKLTPGTLLVETLHVVDCVAPKQLMADKYLPPSIIRGLLDPEHKDRAAALPYSDYRQQRIKVPILTLGKILESQKSAISDMLVTSAALGKEKLSHRKAHATAKVNSEMDQEISRLKALAEVNNNVRTEEIEHLEERKQALLMAIEKSDIRLDAIRVIVAA